ncbi:hypothetical protein EFQ99_05245 [Rhizobium vallis]|uniref:DUF3800 domain-containing protein n=2 Tax=Rhizobium vallis TaxID=634290 RepID=A0A432PMX5_9HYPH|nr:hypothetical protein EFQ99_05245 [Rhizobium vallis]
MLVASMDHSPQEIPNDRGGWHTTALLVSESAEQWGWESTLGPLLNRQSKTLKKWAANRNHRYREEFRGQFPKILASSEVFGLAFSVQGGTVADSLSELIVNLGLSQHILISEREVSVVGLSSGREFAISIVQASYVIYLLYFLCRMHALILDQLRDQGGSPLPYCDWQISPDNFPLGLTGPMAELFSISANSASVLRLIRGNFRVSTHLRGDPGAEVCDNLAGMLRQDLQRGVCNFDLAARPKKGALYWEIHSPTPHIFSTATSI